MMCLRLGGKGSVTDWINDKGVFGTALGSPGLLIKDFRADFSTKFLSPLHLKYSSPPTGD